MPRKRCPLRSRGFTTTATGNVHKMVAMEFGDVDAALADADEVFEDVFYYEGNTHLALEQHATVAYLDGDGKLVVCSSTQTPHYLHRALAKALAMPARHIRVIAAPNGGGFGGKSDPFNHEVAVAKAAVRLGRPVKIRLTREEVFYCHRGRHPVLMRFRTGVRSRSASSGPDVEPGPVMYQPFAQEEIFGGSFIIRTGGDPTAITKQVVAAIRSFDPQALVEKIQTLEQVREERVAPRKVNALLVTSFGTLALVIAGVGIAGVLAFSVSSRTGEIGIRMSLGADAFRVKKMVLGEGWVLLAGGLAVGVIGSLTATRLMSKLLYGVTPYDPMTVSLVALLMATVGTLACWIPAGRAAKVEPATALRSD